jgi:hypothetical protein
MLARFLNAICDLLLNALCDLLLIALCDLLISTCDLLLNELCDLLNAICDLLIVNGYIELIDELLECRVNLVEYNHNLLFECCYRVNVVEYNHNLLFNALDVKLSPDHRWDRGVRLRWCCFLCLGLSLINTFVYALK